MKNMLMSITALIITLLPQFIPITATEYDKSPCTLSDSRTNILLTWQPKALICQLRLEIYEARARRLADEFDYSGGIALVDEALALSPDNPELYTLRGELTLLLYEWNAALEDFNTALALDASYAPAYFHRGVLHYTMTVYEQALDDFQQYMILAPEGDLYELAAQYSDQIESELDLMKD